MDTLAQQLDTKLREWAPATAEQVRQHVAEIIALADQDSRGRTVSKTEKRKVAGGQLA